MRLLSVFHSAAQALIKHENAMRDKSSDEDFAQLQLERTLPKDDWIRAVINGADDHSPRWRHLLALGGLLLGFGPAEDEALSASMRSTIETALVKAANLALNEMLEDEELGQESITLVLNHCFPLLSDLERSQLDYDALLPALMRSMLHSEEGLRSAYFLGAVDLDVQPASNSTFQWHERSASFQQIQRMLASPLVSSLGPLSRLVGHSIEQAKESWLVSGVVEDIESFARTLHLQWRHTKLSEIDTSEENVFLDAEALGKTTPQLWKLLRSTLFAIVIVLRSAIGRMMADGALANDEGERNCDCVQISFADNWDSRTTTSDARSPHAPIPLLHRLENRISDILTVHLRQPGGHGHTERLFTTSRSFPALNPLFRAPCSTTAPTRPVSRPLLSQHRRTFHARNLTTSE